MTLKKYLKIMMYFILVLLFIGIIHIGFIEKNKIVLRFGVIEIYLFNVFFSSFITIALFILKKKYADTVAWMYLIAIFLKLGVFGLVFNGIIFKESVLNTAEKFSVVFPMLIVFGLEAFIVLKIINTTNKTE